MIALLDRYVLRSHAAPFIFGSVTVIFIFLMQFIMNYLQQLVGKGLSEWLIIELIIYNIAWMVILAVPMGVLFSTLMAFGSMSQAHEVTIIKASGGSLVKMMYPVIVMGILLSVGLFWFNDYVLPEANHRAKILMNDIQRKKPTFSLESGQFSTQLEGYTILSRKVDSISGMMTGVTIYDMMQFNRRNIISADTGIIKFSDDFKKLVVNLYHGEVHQLNVAALDNYRIIRFDDYQIFIPAQGFAFEQSTAEMVARGDREMNISDMNNIVDSAKANRQRLFKESDSLIKNNIEELLTGKIQKKPETSIEPFIEAPPSDIKVDSNMVGVLSRVMQKANIQKSVVTTSISQVDYFNGKIGQYEVEIYKKYAIPFACLVFVFVGCPLGIITRGGNFGLSAGISLLFYIFYWACLIGGEKLADRGILAPWLAMWLGNIIVGILGIILTLRVSYESIFFFNSNLLVKLKNLFSKK